MVQAITCNIRMRRKGMNTMIHMHTLRTRMEEAQSIKREIDNHPEVPL
jgi:hypothetical protein